ncbi:MAG: HAD family phosphatase [Demequina sp.]|nr:HAD family phosphatase [Demequina sp.]
MPNRTHGDTARRAIFLDFDGTYAHHGVVPPAHAAAVAAARSRGHAVFLCTGRPLSLLPEDVRASGFDGFVATAGAHVEYRGETLLDVRFSDELAARVMGLLDENDSLYFLETPAATYARRAVAAAMMRHAERTADAAAAQGLRSLVDAFTIQEDLTMIRPSKIMSFAGPVPLQKIAALIGPDVATVSSSLRDLGEGAGEIFLAAVNKATGMAAAIARLGMTRDDVVACGDGPNDVEMLEFAGTSVVIEGSAPELMALADLVAAGPEEAGLVEAFVTLGLIDSP